MKRTVKDWIIATRPWSFPASVTPVVVITAYLFWQSRICGFGIDWTNAVLSFLLMVIAHCGGNLISDYYDHVKGVDSPDCPNGVTWIRSGLFSPKEILHYGCTMVCIAGLIGVAILINSSFEALWVGAACMALTVGYYWFKSHVMGEIDILLCFALLPALGLSFVLTGVWHHEAMLISIPFGLITVAILFANNSRDIENDSNAGVMTLSFAIGLKACSILYILMVTLPYLLIAAYFIAELVPAWCFLTYLSLPLALKNCRQQFDGLDQQSAKLQMLFGTLLTLAFILASLI